MRRSISQHVILHGDLREFIYSLELLHMVAVEMRVPLWLAIRGCSEEMLCRSVMYLLLLVCTACDDCAVQAEQGTQGLAGVADLHGQLPGGSQQEGERLLLLLLSS